MKWSRASACTALVATGALFGTGLSYGEPVNVPLERVYEYSVELPNNVSVSATVDYGNFVVTKDGTIAQLVDETGRPIETFPLEYAYDGKIHPITPYVGQNGKQLTLTPEKILGPTQVVAGTDRQAALDNLMRQVVIGWNNAGPVSTALGAGIGFGIGCLSIFPNFVAGCIIGTILGAGIGAVTGIVNGNPEVQPAFGAFMGTFLP